LHRYPKVIGRGDLAVLIGIIYNWSEKIHCLDDKSVTIQTYHGGIVSAVKANYDPIILL